MTARSIFVTVAALETLALSGCGGQDQQAPETPEESTTTKTVTSASSATQASPQQPTSAEHSTPTPSAPSIAEGTTDVGKQVDVFGQPATVCVYGDGYGLNTVAAGTNTSCEFATETLHQLTQGLNPTFENVRSTLPAAITAHSPATGQDYEMSCGVDANKLVTCWSGNDAAVYMY
ncbi:hypothetical protein [Corynebacterium sanguinis]|uniref:hypothetical protein n=1 Tax=Corynebacterium sanguinis TaxID=2594913 RepID=UPI0021A7AE82|nr:hypothetical protein [Corynebacterium sanguinis]MCT1464740.1 hypothetical protein [Corynebacterium sanguinis]